MFFKSRRSVIPGFGLSLGFTLAYLGLIVLIPLSAVFLKASGMTWATFVEAIASPRVVASYWFSFGVSGLATLANAVIGLVVAWVLVRYSFPGKRFLDALIDLPFALPTAIAGIALTAVYAKNGWVGAWLNPAWNWGVTQLNNWLPVIPWNEWLGTGIAYDRAGVFVALAFVGLPFIVRTLQPVLEELEPELEEASAILGANRIQTITRIIFPQILPALLTGIAMAFARSLGEYGSVVFISSNRPLYDEITPMMIIIKLEQYDYAGATAVAVVMLVASFLLLLVINLLQKWSRRYQAV
ncbi:MAG: sulfate ABC transporter permease subunit [Puniceicoccales bacterium]|jgi:sulfate transport system permease protein|nr:sulfate ABC transporter permease subunit [Puniceicoccales bacterium]